MARVRQTRDETRRVVVSRLDWRSAQRDDQAVAQAIHAGESMDGIDHLDEAGLLDAFYHCDTRYADTGSPESAS